MQLHLPLQIKPVEATALSHDTLSSFKITAFSHARELPGRMNLAPATQLKFPCQPKAILANIFIQSSPITTYEIGWKRAYTYSELLPEISLPRVT
jgi:hypothetical protein